MGRKSRSKWPRAPQPIQPSSPVRPQIPAVPPSGIPTPPIAVQVGGTSAKKPCDSLLDEMVDGREYESIIDKVPRKFDARDEIRRALSEVEAVRKRPVVIYAANQVCPIPVLTAIMPSDDLPFAELVASVAQNETALDVLIETPGGVSQQISQFVQRLRPRFQDVGFIIANRAMSAGTLWALSGNEIWMDERAVLGPIDPQVAGSDGRLIPYQALLTLIRDIQERGDEAIKKNQQPLWTDIQVLRNIDPRQIGDALAQSSYVIQLATEYLKNYKFRDWKFHSTSGKVVTDQDREERAKTVAETLCSHSYWKVHSHGISRDVAEQIVRLQIGNPIKIQGFERALRRLWALLYWIFDKGSVAKIFLGQNYSLFRGLQQVPVLGGQP